MAETVPRGSRVIYVNKRNPSRHRIEEHDMLNLVKANRKALNAEKMRPEKVRLSGG